MISAHTETVHSRGEENTACKDSYKVLSGKHKLSDYNTDGSHWPTSELANNGLCGSQMSVFLFHLYMGVSVCVHAAYDQVPLEARRRQ